MFAFLGVLTGIVSAICWLVWALNGAGEYPERVLGLAVATTLICVLSILLSKNDREGNWI